MKRKINLNQGIVGGYEKDLIVEILPQLEKNFRQRKQFYEYYFDDGVEIELTLEDLDNLSNEFIIKIGYDGLLIEV